MSYRTIVTTVTVLSLAFVAPAYAQGPSWGGSRSPAQQQYRPTPSNPTGGYYNPQTDPFILKQRDLTTKQPYQQRNYDLDDAQRQYQFRNPPSLAPAGPLCCR
jgi:hypothetical protein